MMTDYPGMTFQDCYGKAIDIVEELSLRDAIQNVIHSSKMLDAARYHEYTVCGKEAYEVAKAASELLRRASAEARANYQAAMYRETGHWPHELHGLG